MNLEGSFLHCSYKEGVLGCEDEDQKNKFGDSNFKKATDLLFKLPHVDGNMEADLIHGFRTEGSKIFQD